MNGEDFNMTKEYKHDEFEYFIEQPTGEYEVTGAKSGSKRKRPITRKITIDYDEIDNLDLEKRGEQVPFSHKHVVNTPLYMLYYWSPVIGDRACWLYQQLLTYCREDRDFLWDKLEELEYRVKMSRPTLNKHLDILEENNFIIKIHRWNKLDNKRQTSPIIKVRQTVPLLSEEQYNKLSENGKKHHDKFMSSYGKHSDMDSHTYDSNQTISELTVNGKVKVTNSMKSKINNLIREENAVHYITTKLNSSEEMIVNEFHNLLSDKDVSGLSKPSYDTWMKDSFIIYSEKDNTVNIVLNSFAEKMFNDSLGQTYEPMLKDIIKQLYGLDVENYSGIIYYNFEEYMYKLEGGY